MQLDVLNQKINPGINLQVLEAFLSGYWLTDLANFSSYIFENMENINWVGFYLSDKKSLRLGPFCGKPACMEISFDRGVCGKAFISRETLIVDDVNSFPGHISCDWRSKSEIVIPFYIYQEIVGVLDIDSPIHGRFTLEDKIVLQNAVQILSKSINNYSGVKYGRIY